MSDERLRALERAARADPSDLATGRALAHALLQAGDRRRAFFEYSRLAREGDVDAQHHVMSWSSRAHVWNDDVPICSPLRGQARRATRRFERGPLGEDRDLVGGGDRVVMSGLNVIRVLDDRLNTLWERPGELITYASMRGDDVLHVDGQSLVLRDVDRGDELARAFGVAPAIGAVSVSGDRAVIRHHEVDGRNHGVTVVDVGPRFGHVLWSRFTNAAVWHVADAVVAVESDRIERWDLASGHGQQSVRILPQGRGRRFEWVRSVDSQGIVTIEGTGQRDSDVVTITEYAQPSLEPRWRVDRRGYAVVDAVLMGDVVFVHQQAPSFEPAPVAVIALIDRASGALLAERPLYGRHVLGRPARAGSELYAVLSPDALLTSIGARDLEELRRFDVLGPEVRDVRDVFPIDRGVVIDAGTVIVRLDSDE